MAHYHDQSLIPYTLCSIRGLSIIRAIYIASREQKDNLDGFETIIRVHASQTGDVFVTRKAESHLKVAEHFAIWRAKFGVMWALKPVFNDEKVIKEISQLHMKLPLFADSGVSKEFVR